MHDKQNLKGNDNYQDCTVLSHIYIVQGLTNINTSQPARLNKYTEYRSLNMLFQSCGTNLDTFCCFHEDKCEWSHFPY